MKIKQLIISFFLVTIQVSHAQVNYTVKHYTSENGLPQNSIKDISADSEGFIWLATEDGLVRFDGRRFYVFNRSNLGIKSNRVTRIEPYSGNVTPSEVMQSHRSHTTSVSHAYFEEHEAIRIENGTAVKDTTIQPYVEKQMKAMSNGHENIIYMPGLPDWNQGLTASNRYQYGSSSKRGDFYLSDSTGVSFYKQFEKQYDVAIKVPRIWHYFSVGERLYYFHDQKYFTKIFENKVAQFALAGDILHDPAYRASGADIKLYWNNNSNQAFLLLQKNLYALEPQKGGDLVTRLLIEGFDVVAAGVERIYSDNQRGKVFLGSITNGLYVVSKKQFRALTVKGGYGANIFYAQLPYQTGTVLTPTGVVAGLDARLSRMVEKRLPALEKANPGDKRALLRDNNGTIWVKNYEEFFHLDADAKQIIGKWRLKGEIRTICQGKDGLIWMGVTDDHLYSVNPDSPEKGPMPMDLVSIPAITVLESQDPGHLLAGTTSGLYRVGLVSKKIELIAGSKDLHIKSIHVEGQNRVWITAEEKGVILMDGRGKLTAFPMDKNRYLASPHCVVNDGNGYLWVPTNKGLFQMAIKDLLSYAKLTETGRKNALFYSYYTMEDGFNTNEFNGSCQPCGLMLSNGYISLPSLNGLVWFNPKNVRAFVPEGGLVLDGADANGQSLPVKGDSIHFPLRPENIRLHFATAYFGNEYNLNLSYALVKDNTPVKETGWNTLDNNDFTVKYSSLNPGNYTLLVRKKSGFGINNEGVKKLHLVIPQEWYETKGAIILFSFMLVIGLLVLTYVYSRYRLAATERENKRLEAIIEKRTESLNQALHKVEESKDDLAQQMHLFSRLVASISHDVQSPLRYIAFVSQKIPQMIEMDQLDKASRLGTTIFDLSDRMSSMLLDLLDFIKVSVYGKRVHFENIRLKKLVDTKLELFKNLVDRNNSYFINDVPSVQTVFSDYQFLSIVIHNLIDNAAKYTYNGHVRIFMRPSTEYKAELVISNTGRGIPLQMVEMMNSPIEENNLEDLMQSGTETGLGLLIVKEVGKLAGITIKVTQTDVTSFHLFFE